MKSDETMNYLNLIRGTVLKMNQATFAQWKDALVGQYIVFSVIAPEEIDQEIMAEKLCDYFEKAELKNGKSFEKFVEVYFSNLDSIVAGRVVKTPQQRKKDEAPLPMPRARKYYEKAQEIRKGKLNLSGMIDYTRIMMCLYAAIIKNNGKEIQNFDFATSSLKIDDIILSMKEEQDALGDIELLHSLHEAINANVEQAIEAAFSEAYRGDNLVVPRELLSDAFRMAGVA